jgi:hypothetical protein
MSSIAERKPVLPKLRIVDAERLFLHERVDEARVTALVEALRRDGVLKNPPLALPISTEDDAYVVLDGATRTMGFKSMGIAHMLVQEARLEVDDVSFHYWHQAVVGGQEEELLERLRPAPDLKLVRLDPDSAERHESERDCIAQFTFGGERRWEAKTEDLSLAGIVAALNRVQEACQSVGAIERTELDHWTDLAPIFPDLVAVVKYREMPLERILQAAVEDLRLPGGVTRFVVSPRALRLHYPLDELERKASLMEKQQSLSRWIRKQIRQRKVRYYSESTYLFDE